MVFGAQAPGQDAALVTTAAAALGGWVPFAWGVRRLGKRSRLATVAGSLVYVIFFFGLLEVATRSFGPSPNPVLAPHPTRLWQLRADLTPQPSALGVWTNHEGLRARQEYAVPRPPDVLRVLCLGDSWMYGLSVEQDQTIPVVLQNLLQPRLPGRRVEVVNGAVFGYGVAQGRATFEELARLQPQVVLLGQFHNTNTQQAVMRWQAGGVLGVRWLLQRSQLYLWLRLKLAPVMRRVVGAYETDHGAVISAYDDYRAIVAGAAAAGAAVVFVEYRVPPDDWPAVHRVDTLARHKANDYEDAFERVAHDSGTPLVQASYFLVPGGDRYVNLQVDRHHPNALGCRYIAERVVDAVARAAEASH